MKKALVVLSPGFEEIEAVTIIDLLRRAGIFVSAIGLEPDFITGSHGITIKCDAQIDEIDPSDYDAIILPGGQPGTNNMKHNNTITEWLRLFNDQGKMVAAICAAPLVLREAGLTANKKITSYPAEENVFSDSAYQTGNVVCDGNLITSRGVGTAIEFALELVSKMKNENEKNDLAAKILFQY